MEVLSLMGYIRGSWSPMKKSKFLAVWVQIILLLCHNKAYKEIKKKFSVKIGVVKNIVWYEGKGDSFLDKLNARLAFFVNNELSLLPILNRVDFIGLNFYFSNLIKNFIVCNPCDPESDLGWWISFDGLRNVLVSLRKTKKDIYITENGLADANDEKRKWFIKNMLISAHEAMDANEVNLKGYFHWTLTDNFEWHHGYWPEFGFVKIDRKNNLKRIKRPSFDYYKMICKTGIVEDTI
jgi:beta-glucosidase/6-phospho-beta-glucosidase/beta-galactosidase